MKKEDKEKIAKDVSLSFAGLLEKNLIDLHTAGETTKSILLLIDEAASIEDFREKLRSDTTMPAVLMRELFL